MADSRSVIGLMIDLFRLLGQLVTVTSDVGLPETLTLSRSGHERVLSTDVLSLLPTVHRRHRTAPVDELDVLQLSLDQTPELFLLVLGVHLLFDGTVHPNLALLLVVSLGLAVHETVVDVLGHVVQVGVQLAQVLVQVFQVGVHLGFNHLLHRFVLLVGEEVIETAEFSLDLAD